MYAETGSCWWYVGDEYGRRCAVYSGGIPNIRIETAPNIAERRYTGGIADSWLYTNYQVNQIRRPITSVLRAYHDNDLCSRFLCTHMQGKTRCCSVNPLQAVQSTMAVWRNKVADYCSTNKTNKPSTILVQTQSFLLSYCQHKSVLRVSIKNN